MKKILSHGAEAIIIDSGEQIIKRRIVKGYRYKELDEEIRKRRTRIEAKIIEKLQEKINVPKIHYIDELTKEITMEKINGKKLAEIFEKTDYTKLAKKIGKMIAIMHDNEIIHGDLTTSNIIYNQKNKKLYFIDFGLGIHSSKIEDKAVDVHLIKQALEAKHPKIYGKAFKAILKGYESSKNYIKVIKQLELVEKRGRYKAQY